MWSAVCSPALAAVDTGNLVLSFKTSLIPDIKWSNSIQITLGKGPKIIVKVRSLTKLADPPPYALVWSPYRKIFFSFFLATNLFQTL